MCYTLNNIMGEEMMERIIYALKQLGADDAACINYQDCEIINPKLVDRLDFVPRSVIIATIPYYTKYCNEYKIVSSYALPYDYHIYLKEIAQTTIEKAKSIFPEASFEYFADHSPINEKNAAAKAGLGIIGKHSLLITPYHSSFVFLLEILTDLECDSIAKEVKHCIECNKCVEACPTFLKNNGPCLSAITQKKGNLTEDEIVQIENSGCAWGCDICQMACPHTQTAIKNGTIYTNAKWFNSNICALPSDSSLNDEDDFKKRAYSWRGKSTVLRNIKIIIGNSK